MNNPFYASHPELFQLNEHGRVVVDKHLTTKDGLYVIGDSAATSGAGLALTAVEHANFVAKDIKARMHGKKRPTKYESTPIMVVPLDTSWAVLQYKSISLHGWVIAQVRRAADYIGYSDVLGHLKALTIWSNGERTENNCPVCDRSR
jgi:NADH dehydrogenase FAD-containing subunit